MRTVDKSKTEATEFVCGVINRLSMAPTCLDMGWAWVVKQSAGRIFLTCSFRRPDTNTGKVDTGYGREWVVDVGAAESAIVKTCWLAMQQILAHELHEAFMLDGARVFDPHVDVRLLCAVNKVTEAVR